MAISILALGDLALDIVLGPLSELPAWGNESEAATGVMRLGGNLGNFVVAAQALGLPLRVAGLVGEDENGVRLVRDLAALGYPTDLVRTVPHGTTCISVGFYHHKGERLFVTYPGVLDELDGFIRAAAFPTTDVAFLTGWCQPPRVGAAILAPFCDSLATRGTTTVMDLSWNERSWASREDVLEVLRHVDYALMNRDELGALSGETGVDAALATLGARLGSRPTIVAKLGRDGAAARLPSGAVLRASAPPAGTASAVGAGDTFNAGFISARFVEGIELESALAKACAFASAMMRSGRPSFPVPTAKAANEQ
jgi:ribokinase